jgi:hypothetical protein
VFKPSLVPLRGAVRLAFVLALGVSSSIGCADDELASEDSSEAELASAQVAPEDMSDEQLTAAGYERTPFGFAHRDCVYDIGDGAVVDEASGVVTLADGSKMHPPRCEHPVVRRGGRPAASPSKNALSTVNAAPPPPAVNGWIESTYWYAPSFITHLKAAFHAPDLPTLTTSQLLYWFPAIVPDGSGAIYQPVLSYNYAGSRRYEIASWYVGPNVYHSALTPVLPNAGIIGTIDGASCTTTGTCTYTVVTNAWTEGKKATLTVRGGGAQKWAYMAFEAYYLNTCAELPPAGKIGFYQIELAHDATRYTPIWSNSFATPLPTGCPRGISSPSPTIVDLKWR